MALLALHITHTVIKIKEYRSDLGFKFIKSPIVSEIEIKIPLSLILNNYKIELTNWFTWNKMSIILRDLLLFWIYKGYIFWNNC